MAIVVLSVLSGPVLAWKPNQHVGLGHILLDDLADHMVNIRGKDYSANNLIADAILTYPQYYLMGTIGPDAYPDILFGQTVIHPDTVSEGGDRVSYSYEWLDHLLASASNYYSTDQGKSLAFAYGFLTHAGGDMWCHTFINRFAGGVWPPLGPSADLRIPARHVVAEAYVDDFTQWSSINPFSDSTQYEQFFSDSTFHRGFLYSTFIDNDWAKSHGKSQLFDLFFGLKDWIDETLASWDWWDGPWWQVWYLGVGDIVHPYLEAWRDDIADGLKAWTLVSSKVAYNLFIADNFDQAVEELKEWAINHFLSMIGLPDGVGAVIDVVGDIVDFIVGLLSNLPGLKQLFQFFHNIKDMIVDWIFETVFGVSISELKSMLTDPEKWLSGEIPWITGEALFENAPYGMQTKQRIDAELAPSLSGGSFDPYKFDITYNSIMISKLIVLDGAGLNQVLSDYGVQPLYTPVSADTPDKLAWSGMSIMQGFMKSLDANHQWMTTAPDGKSYGAGMPLWENIEAREGAFKKLFHIGLDMNMQALLDIVPGDTGVFSIEVINNGNLPDTFKFALEGLPDKWEYQFSASEVVLDSGAFTFVQLSVKPYRHWSTAPGDYSFSVTGTSQRTILPQHEIVTTKTEKSIVHVLPFYEPSVSITPETLATGPGGTKTYLIEVRNYGNVQDSFQLTFSFTDLGALCDAFPTAIQAQWTVVSKTSFTSMNPGQSDFATISITIPSDWAGMENTPYEFTAIATSQTDPSAIGSDSSTLVVQPTKESKCRYIDLELKWLADMVRNSGLEPSIVASLLDQLNAAILKEQQALDYVLVGKIKMANNMLRASGEISKAFIDLVLAQRGKYIPEAIADLWIARAQEIRVHIRNAISTP